MNLALYYYLFGVYGELINIGAHVLGFLILYVTGSLIFLIISYDSREEQVENIRGKAKKSLRPVCGILIFMCLMSVITPSKKDIAIIAGLKLSEKGTEKAISDVGGIYPLLKEIVIKELTEIAKDKK